MDRMRKLVTVPLALTGAAAAGLAYAAKIEPNLFRLRRVEVPILPRGIRPLRILQVSDIHMIPGQYRKIRWLRSLAALEPDFVIDTGDNLSHPDGIGAALDGLEPLMDFPGAFVMGSNDYLASRPLNPTKYLRKGDPSTRTPVQGARNDWEQLRDAFTKTGWLDLTNRTARLELPGPAGPTIGLIGVDDPHIRKDKYEEASKNLTRTENGRTVPATDVTLGIVHAPYRRVLNAMNNDGIPLILAGHTHGGQLRLPFIGALVTNCDLDRRRASGLSTYGTSHLHVSAGCGTSRYARVRFCCPPEATLLTLTERS
jgi:uncharacterized protein